jgi:hypothetical protein
MSTPSLVEKSREQAARGVASHPASALPLTITGRWQPTSDGGLLASWTGAALRMRCRARTLGVRFGPQTARMDRENGGLRTVVVTVREAGRDTEHTAAHDVSSGDRLVLFEGEEVQEADVEIRLVDWASRVHIASFEVTDVSPVSHLSRILD